MSSTSSQKNWQFVACEWLSLLGIFSFPWRFGLSYNLKICDIFFALAAFFLFWSLLTRRDNPDVWSGERTFVRHALFAMAGIMIGSVVGIIWSTIVFPGWVVFWREVAVEYARMIFTFGLFWFMFYLGLRDGGFVRRAAAVMIVSSLPLWISRIPSLHDAFFGADERLRGPVGDPGYLGSWIAVSLVMAAAVFLFYPVARKPWLEGRGNGVSSDWKERFAALAVVFSLPLLLWTGSRGAVISGLVGLVAVGIYYLVRGPAGGKFKKLLLLAAFIIAGGILSYSAASPALRQTTVYRQVGSYANSKTFKISNISRSNFIMPLSDGGGKDRLELGLRALALSARSPLGFGPQYYYWQPVANTFLGGSLPAHDIYMEVALRAGWFGFACFLYILWLIGKRLVAALRESSWLHAGVMGAFSIMLIFSLASDTLTLRWFWVIAAFAASLTPFSAREKIVISPESLYDFTSNKKG